MTSLPDINLGSNDPLYNIGVVARMTGISMATLRAWERRYDFPASTRTAGGHRLYSENDVLRLQWVKARIDDGMATSQAINALRHQEQAGRISMVRAPEDEVFKQEVRPQFLDTYKERLLKALTHRDLTTANDLLSEAAVLASLEDVIQEVIAPVMAEIGEAWESRAITVATEHLSTNFLRQKLLMYMLSAPPPHSVAPVVLACAPNEWHEGSLLILGTLLRRRRWPVVYLGQAVPLADLAIFIGEVKPSVVAVVAMTELTAVELLGWRQWLPDVASSGRPVFGFGGRVFSRQPEWRTRLPGLFLGTTIQEGLEHIERILR